MNQSNSMYYNLANIRKLASNAGIKYYNNYSKKELCEMLDIEFVCKPPKPLFNHPYYNLAHIRKMATNAGIKNSHTQYNKRKLCELLGVECKYKREMFSYVLTNIQTNEIKIFESASTLGNNFNIGHYPVLNKARTGEPLVVNGVSYMVKKMH